MNQKEILLRINEGSFSILEQEIKNKRNLGVANSITDTFIIRLLEAYRDDSRAFLFKIEKNKLIVRKYSTLNHDDHR